MTKTDEIIDKINCLLQKKNFVVVAIDGKCGSGKTTFAEQLKNHFNASIIHCDDFYLPLEKRTSARYQEAGGNIDYERFKTEIIDHLHSDSVIIYQRLDCQTMKLKKPTKLHKKKMLIIEGSYALHPYFQKYYDLSIFMDIDASLQLKRLKSRESEKNFAAFIQFWIPLENHYFESYQIKNKADYILTIT